MAFRKCTETFFESLFSDGSYSADQKAEILNDWSNILKKSGFCDAQKLKGALKGLPCGKAVLKDNEFCASHSKVKNAGNKCVSMTAKKVKCTRTAVVDGNMCAMHMKSPKSAPSSEEEKVEPKKKCDATTLNGTKCSKNAVVDEDFCKMHLKKANDPAPNAKKDMKRAPVSESKPARKPVTPKLPRTINKHHATKTEADAIFESASDSEQSLDHESETNANQSFADPEFDDNIDVKDEETVADEETVVDDDNDENTQATCAFKFSTGAKKGQMCPAVTQGKLAFCNAHQRFGKK